MMEIDIDEVEEVDGSSGGVQGALQLLLCLLDSGGRRLQIPARGEANVDGGEVVDDQW